MSWLIPLLTAAALAAPAMSREQQTIPRAYRGDWALSLQQCAPGPADSGNLRIGARTIWTFESRIDVRRVRIVGTSSIDFASQVHHSGAIYGDHSRLTLISNSVEGRMQLGVGDGEDQQIYVRCGS
jgi:hypothetical protein